MNVACKSEQSRGGAEELEVAVTNDLQPPVDQGRPVPVHLATGAGETGDIVLIEVRVQEVIDFGDVKKPIAGVGHGRWLLTNGR